MKVKCQDKREKAIRFSCLSIGEVFVLKSGPALGSRILYMKVYFPTKNIGYNAVAVGTGCAVCFGSDSLVILKPNAVLLPEGEDIQL